MEPSNLFNQNQIINDLNILGKIEIGNNLEIKNPDHYQDKWGKFIITSEHNPQRLHGFNRQIDPHCFLNKIKDIYQKIQNFLDESPHYPSKKWQECIGKATIGLSNLYETYKISEQHSENETRAIYEERENFKNLLSKIQEKYKNTLNEFSNLQIEVEEYIDENKINLNKSNSFEILSTASASHQLKNKNSLSLVHYKKDLKSAIKNLKDLNNIEHSEDYDNYLTKFTFLKEKIKILISENIKKNIRKEEELIRKEKHRHFISEHGHLLNKKSKSNVNKIFSQSQEDIEHLKVLNPEKNRFYANESNLGFGFETFNQIYAATGQHIGSKGVLKKNYLNVQIPSYTPVVKSIIKLKEPLLKELVKNEIKILLELKNDPHFVKILDHSQFPSQGVLKQNIFFEYCSRGDLSHYLTLAPKPLENKSSFSQILIMIENILEGLTILEEKGIRHGDIKLQNIFITKELRAIIGDFGFANRTQEMPKQHVPIGTPIHMAPEYLNGIQELTKIYRQKKQLVESEKEYKKNKQKLIDYQKRIDALEIEIRAAAMAKENSKATQLIKKLDSLSCKFIKLKQSIEEFEIFHKTVKNQELLSLKEVTSTKNDIFAFGTMLYYILFNSYHCEGYGSSHSKIIAWNANQLNPLRDKIKELAHDEKEGNPVKSGLLLMLYEALNPVHDERPYARDLLQKFQEIKT